MVFPTEQAVIKFKVLILEHPEDPIVRLMVRDLDEARLSFNIILEDKVQPDDEVQEVKGYCHVWTLPNMQGLLNE